MALFDKKQVRFVRWVVIIFLLALVAMIRMYISFDAITLTTIQAQATMLQQYVAAQYWHAVFWYMLLFICASMGGIPITILLTVVGGFLFGAVLGTLYATAAATIGTLCVVLFVRHGLQDLVYSYMRTRRGMYDEVLD